MTCKNDGRPVVAKGLCQKCYDRERSSKRNYLKNECRNGHRFEDGSFKLSRSGKRICLVCLEENRKTHCPHGHEYTDENTYYTNGSPQCKTCRNQRMRDRRPASGIGTGGLNKAKTHCPKGHRYDESNTRYSTDGKRRYCHACALENSRIQRIKDHGVSIDDFQYLLDKQKGLCAICTNPITLETGRAIDHDHSCCPGPTSCGKCVRGVLCKSCNVMLGFAKDNSDILKNAIIYLERV